MSREQLHRELDRPDRDLTKGHPLLQHRWPNLRRRLEAEGFAMFVNEVYRTEIRAQWLWAQGRSAADCRARGIPEDFARSGLRVTNAYSAARTAHGWIRYDGGLMIPAAAAIDVVPLGADNQPWSKDDPWEEFVALIARIGPDYGLVHFTSPGKGTWDKPHLELVEWDNRTHQLVLPAAA